jgi:hypothetical protein
MHSSILYARFSVSRASDGNSNFVCKTMHTYTLWVWIWEHWKKFLSQLGLGAERKHSSYLRFFFANQHPLRESKISAGIRRLQTDVSKKNQNYIIPKLNSYCKRAPNLVNRCMNNAQKPHEIYHKKRENRKLLDERRAHPTNWAQSFLQNCTEKRSNFQTIKNTTKTFIYDHKTVMNIIYLQHSFLKFLKAFQWFMSAFDVRRAMDP